VPSISWRSVANAVVFAPVVAPQTHGRRLQDAGDSATQDAKAESAALLVDEIFPEQPLRQWVLSFPYPLRFLFASRPAIRGKVLGIVYRAIPTH
jgi:hypothetical protein